MRNSIYVFLKNLLPPTGSILLKFSGLQNYNSVLDIGCGKESVLRVFRNEYKTGVDAFQEYVDTSKERKIHNDYIVGDITKMDMSNILQKYEAVIVFDLIEHLSEEEAIRLIEILESSINIKFIAIKTPSSYVDQNEYDGNVFQKHKSSISSNFFKKRNYKIFGVDGPKYLYLNGTKMKETSSLWSGLISLILRPIYTFFPNKSLNYLAILKKDIN